MKRILAFLTALVFASTALAPAAHAQGWAPGKAGNGTVTLSGIPHGTAGQVMVTNDTPQTAWSMGTGPSGGTGTSILLTPDAANATNGTGGGVLISLSAPTGTGSEAGLVLKRGSTVLGQIGAWSGAPTQYGSLWLGLSNTPNGANYTILADGLTNTILNAPTNLWGYIGGVATWITTSAAFYPYTDNSVYLGGSGNRWIQMLAFGWGAGQAPGSDVAPTNLTVTTMAPYASATTNTSSGDLIVNFQPPIGTPGGSAPSGGEYGALRLQTNGTDTVTMGSYAAANGGATGYGAVWFQTARASMTANNAAFLATTNGSTTYLSSTADTIITLNDNATGGVNLTSGQFGPFDDAQATGNITLGTSTTRFTTGFFRSGINAATSTTGNGATWALTGENALVAGAAASNGYHASAVTASGGKGGNSGDATHAGGAGGAWVSQGGTGGTGGATSGNGGGGGQGQSNGGNGGLGQGTGVGGPGGQSGVFGGAGGNGGTAGTGGNVVLEGGNHGTGGSPTDDLASIQFYTADTVLQIAQWSGLSSDFMYLGGTGTGGAEFVPSGITIGAAVTSYTVQQTLAANASAPSNLIIKPQGPGGSCSSSANCSPGDLIINVAPAGATGTPTRGAVLFEDNSNVTAQIGNYASVASGLNTYGAVWLGAAMTPSSSNPILLAAPAVAELNAPSGGSVYFGVAASALVQVNGSAIAPATDINGVAIGTALLRWSGGYSQTGFLGGSSTSGNAVGATYSAENGKAGTTTFNGGDLTLEGGNGTGSSLGTAGNVIALPGSGGTNGRFDVRGQGNSNPGLSFATGTGLFYLGSTSGLSVGSTNWSMKSDNTNLFVNGLASGYVLFDGAGGSTTGQGIQVTSSGMLGGNTAASSAGSANLMYCATTISATTGTTTLNASQAACPRLLFTGSFSSSTLTVVIPSEQGFYYVDTTGTNLANPSTIVIEYGVTTKTITLSTQGLFLIWGNGSSKVYSVTMT